VKLLSLLSLLLLFHKFSLEYILKKLYRKINRYNNYILIISHIRNHIHSLINNFNV